MRDDIHLGALHLEIMFFFFLGKAFGSRGLHLDPSSLSRHSSIFCERSGIFLAGF
jgi:hypothetical protein